MSKTQNIPDSPSIRKLKIPWTMLGVLASCLESTPDWLSSGKKHHTFGSLFPLLQALTQRSISGLKCYHQRAPEILRNTSGKHHFQMLNWIAFILEASPREISTVYLKEHWIKGESRKPSRFPNRTILC